MPRRLRRSSGSVSVPGPPQAIAAGVTQTGAGALILAGLATPLAASAITATMLTAIDRVHLKKGPWITNGGYEYNVVLIAAGLLLAEISPEPISFDAPLGDRLDGTRWAIAALAAGATGVAGVDLYARRLAPTSRLSGDSGDTTPLAAAQHRSIALWTDRSVPLGKYSGNSPLVFSLVPRCQGACGSQN